MFFFISLQLSSFLPLYFKFGCLVVYLSSFLLLPIPQGGRWRSSRSSLSNGIWAQAVSDESSAWLDHLYLALQRTNICISEPLQTFQGRFEQTYAKGREQANLGESKVSSETVQHPEERNSFSLFRCWTQGVEANNMWLNMGEKSSALKLNFLVIPSCCSAAQSASAHISSLNWWI